MEKGTVKERVLEVVKQLPADATLEDVMERLYFLAKIERGLADADAGRVTPHDEIRSRFSI
jgi:predicted transcriptional regulator